MLVRRENLGRDQDTIVASGMEDSTIARVLIGGRTPNPRPFAFQLQNKGQ